MSTSHDSVLSDGSMPVTTTLKTKGQSGHDASALDESVREDALSRELQALRRSEAALRDFVETTTIALHWMGQDGAILWANQAELDLLGYTREEYFGRHISDFHADQEVIDEILASLSRGDRLCNFPARLRHRDGSIRHVLIDSSALFEDGKFVHTRCFTRDVTALRLEEDQREEQRHLNALSAHIGKQLLGNATLPDMLQRCTDAMFQELGVASVSVWTLDGRGEALELQARSGADPGPRALTRRMLTGADELARVAAERKPRVENQLSADSGVPDREWAVSQGMTAFAACPLTGDDGPLGLLVLFSREALSDVTRAALARLADQVAIGIVRKRVESALRERERQLNETLEAIPAAVYTTDAEGRLTFFNQAAVDFSGRVPELGTDSWCVTWKLYNPDGSRLPHDQCPMAIALKEKRPVRGCEAVAERPDGSRRNFIPFPTPLFDESGNLVGAVNMLVDITDRKRAEWALRDSEERFRAIVETTPECVKVVAPDGALLHMNAAGLAMVGAPAVEDVIGTDVCDLIAPEFRDAFRQFTQRVCRGEKGSLEFDITGLRGVRRHMETHAAPLPRPDGSLVQLAITRDITERKRAENAMRLLGAIVDSSDDAIISKDLRGTITSWNKSAERVFGYQADETIGRSVTMLIPPDRLDEEPGILARLQRGERVDHFETVRRHKDGSLIDVSLTISPVRDSAGTIIGASKIARDITERKRVEAALVESEGRFRQLADSMPQMVWTARPDGYLDYFNQRWYEFTGANRDVLGSTSWELVLHPEDMKRSGETWSAAVESGQPFQIECRFRDRSEKRWRWFVGRALPARDARGNIVKWFGTWTDIDEQKRVEDELRQANGDLEQFAFSASHDLQEPLRAIRIYGELLTERHASKLDGEALEFLNYLSTGASRMEVLVRDLLAYTQVANSEPPEDPVDANEVLATSLADLHVAIDSSGAQVTSGTLPAVLMHAAHLKQIFQNLIGNAIKYRSPEREILVDVSAERQNESWIFAVRDNGIGIEPQYKEQIFGLFTRLHTGEEYSGTGIGLAICQRIVERYGGRIWVQSEPGQGCTFRFAIPG
jgi:PAS domain S-box-containing protein